MHRRHFLASATLAAAPNLLRYSAAGKFLGKFGGRSPMPEKPGKVPPYKLHRLPS